MTKKNLDTDKAGDSKILKFFIIFLIVCISILYGLHELTKLYHEQTVSCVRKWFA